MGEITEALRRARAARAGEDRGSAALPEPPSKADAARDGAPRGVPGRGADAGAPPPPRPPREGGEPIAAISRVKAGDWVARAVLVAPEHPTALAFRRFAIRLDAEIQARRSLLVTSALRREGKTTVACNLALALASMTDQRRVALVDLDLHRPGVARGLGIRPRLGLERVLAGEAPLEAARLPTELAALDVFAAGGSRSQAHDILSSRRFHEVMAALSEGYEAVVIDTPPVLLLPDVQLMAPQVGACVAIVRAGSTPRSAFRELLGALPLERLVGCFLNDARLPRHARYGYDYGERSDETLAETSAGS